MADGFRYPRCVPLLQLPVLLILLPDQREQQGDSKRGLGHAGSAAEIGRRPQVRDDGNQDGPEVGRQGKILSELIAYDGVGECCNDVDNDGDNDDGLDAQHQPVQECTGNGSHESRFVIRAFALLATAASPDNSVLARCCAGSVGQPS